MERQEVSRSAGEIASADLLVRIAAEYDRGQLPEALRLAEEFAPLPRWQGAQPCALASRLAMHAGAPLLATRLAVRAIKADPADAPALEQYGYQILQRRGPLALRRVLQDYKCEDGAPSDRADLLALEALAALSLRDFGAAETIIARAESLAPGRAWIHLQRASLLEHLDRLDEALTITERACELHPHPFFRPGVQARARLLQLLNRDGDAIDLLQQSITVLRSGLVVAQLYSLLSENERWSEAASALEEFAALSPLLEARGKRWLIAEDARIAYRLGKRAAAANSAQQIKDEFHEKFAQRLLEPPPADERIALDVSFVRQHFKTCAPATLAAIGAFWKMPADHLRLAEAMCYDGTPSSQQRDWATRNGWWVREFRVTRESAHALLARRVPFAIATVEATSAHMMAVIGFDLTRETLLLRDPSQPYVIEVATGPFLERYRPFGPRGVLFIPESEQRQIDGVDLPEAALYDERHEVSLALARYDREAATRALDRMIAQAPDAPLTLEARFELAGHDENVIEQTHCLDKLLELFPGNVTLLLRRLDCMHQASREDRVRFLEGPCSDRKADPALLIAMARALTGDARRQAEAWRCAKRALRLRPTESAAIKACADLMWERGELDEAVEWHQFAALAEQFHESLWRSWFLACRQTRRSQQALELLQDRFERFGAKSPQPTVTLAWAWSEMGQPQQAREVLQAAIRLRPDDGVLLLRSASLIAGLGEAAEASQLLEAARGKTRESDWLRARMDAAERSLDHEAALAIARELLEKEPVALDAVGAMARALARREGITVARKAIREICENHPRHCGLRRLLLEWSRGAEPDLIVAIAEELLQVEPSDAWALRELSYALVRLKRDADALDRALEAQRIEPENTYSASTLGALHQRAGRINEAREALRRAIRASVDNEYAITLLIELARSDEERKTDLTFIEQELLRQVVSGDGLLAYAGLARPILEPESLLQLLKQAHVERPDLWHAWAALVSQLIHTGAFDEALKIASQACERFPYLSRVWLDLATVHQRRGVAGEEIEALERAFEVNPGFALAAMSLASAYERTGRLAEARSTYERALLHSALDASLHAAYASLLWRLREPDAAFLALERALRLRPGDKSAAEDLRTWAAEAGAPERAVELARALSRERSGEPAAWLLLAGTLPASQNEERLLAVDRAIELNRQLTDAWDLKARLLVADRRFDAAVETCEQGLATCLAETEVLAGRRAWIEAQRHRTSEAIRLMKDVLATNKAYAWGWYLLAEWLLATRDTSGAMDALKTMRELWPHNTWVKRQLALVFLQQQDLAAARSEFEKCLELDPTDVVAAHNLLGLQLDAREFESTSRTLEVMRAHQPGAATLAAEIGVRLHQSDTTGALELLQQLCASPDPNPWPLNEAADQFQRFYQSERALPVVKRALKAPHVNPQAAVAAIRMMVSLWQWGRAVRFFLALGPGEARSRAAAPLAQALGENGHKLALRWLLWRRAQVLHENDASWGQVGFALTKSNRMRAAVDWMSDWRQRENVEPWMLFNYCLALRSVGLYPEASAVAEHVTRTLDAVDGAGDFHLFLAIEYALAGQADEARLHLERARVREGVKYDQQICALARALVEFEQTAPAQRREAFGTLRETLNAHFEGVLFFNLNRDARRTFQRAQNVFVRGGAGFRAWWWFQWKRHWQWSMLPAGGALIYGATIVVGISGFGILPAIILFSVVRLLTAGARSRS